MEEWRSVPGYYGDKYEVSNRGRVRNKLTGKVLKPFVKRDYLCVYFYLNGKDCQQYVHRLVAQAFIGPVPTNNHSFRELPSVVNHIDGNKKNNWLENLEYASMRENTLHYHIFLGRRASDDSIEIYKKLKGK